jgi:AraC-like DNA-binding protein
MDKAERLRAEKWSYEQIAEVFGTSGSTVRRRMKMAQSGVTFTESLTAKHMKRFSVDIDRDTLAQINALSEVWEQSRMDVFRILVDWGLETASQDAHCRRAIEKAAIDA